MDGNNQPNNHSGFLSHILDPQLGQVFNTLVRSVLPHHEQNSQASGSVSPAPSTSLQVANEPPSELAAPDQPGSIETDSVSRTEDANAHASSSVASRPSPEQTGSASAPLVSPVPSVTVSGMPDVEMASAEEPRASVLSEPPSRPPSASRNTRRARVEDEEDEDYLRESNRQRMHSPTPHDDDARHHFMPIPEDHGVPQSSQRSRSPSQPSADSSRNQSPEAPQAQGRMMWTFDIGPAPQPAHGDAQAADGAHQGHDHHHAHDHGRHDQLPTLNFFINIPITGAPTQPGAANISDGANGPANAGFPFMPLPFPLGQFGMDMIEERDDPERAKRLVEGLEEVPVGLVKRMERVGGPGTSQGETPTCAVCWESLLDPVGGGFEGNVELAREEAAQAAREDAASQQERESSMEVDSPAPASPSASSSSPCAASSATASGSSGEGPYPKIVVLPCSHVFHASCLLPWFSKPGRTTCPSCRFDIDPDSLTYRPRPLRARRPEPQAAPQPAAAPQPQQPPVYGPPPPPPSAPHPPQPSVAPAASAQAAPQPPHAGAAPDANGQPGQGRNAEGQQLPTVLPPFITFDISMIIPVFPGRPADPAQPANGAQPANPGAQANPQGAQPPPLRTDRNGFRLDDPILQEAVRSTFERIFGRPAPPPQGQPAPQPQPQQAAGATEGAAPTENAPRDVPPDWYMFAGPLPGFPPMPPPNARRSAPPRPAPVRKWTLPPPPGPTLRQLVERNERQMGLRCSDVSCGLGPSDDDPTTTFDTTALRQISIRPLKSDASGKEAVCEHKFHPSCLVSAERVAGWGGEDKKEERENEGEDVEVSCPVCRAVGVISRLDWDEGACALA